MIKIIEKSYCVGYYLNDNIYLINYKPVVLSIENYFEIIDIAKFYSDKHNGINLIYTQAKGFKIDKDLWYIMKKKSHEHTFINSNAIVVKSKGHRLMTKLFILFNKDSTPTKIFSNVADARQWIDNLLN